VPGNPNPGQLAWPVKEFQRLRGVKEEGMEPVKALPNSEILKLLHKPTLMRLGIAVNLSSIMPSAVSIAKKTANRHNLSTTQNISRRRKRTGPL
jgi:hypothetical protein